MQRLSVREMRQQLGKLDSLLEEQKEIIVTQNNKAIARILPVNSIKARPDHAALRSLQQQSLVDASVLIRLDRDER